MGCSTCVLVPLRCQKRSLQLEAVALAKGKLQRPLTRTGVCLRIKWVIYGTSMIDPNIDEDFKTLEFFLMFIDVYVIWRLLGGIPTIKFKKIGWIGKQKIPLEVSGTTQLLSMTWQRCRPVHWQWIHHDLFAWICHPRSLTAHPGKGTRGELLSFGGVPRWCLIFLKSTECIQTKTETCHLDISCWRKVWNSSPRVAKRWWQVGGTKETH